MFMEMLTVSTCGTCPSSEGQSCLGQDALKMCAD